MAARVSSALGLFVSQANVRGFILPLDEVIEYPTGSLTSILTNARLARNEEMCVTQACASTEELTLCAMGGSAAAPKLAPGYTSELLHAQIIESVDTVRLTADGLRSIQAMRKAGYKVGLYSNVAAPYLTKIKEQLDVDGDDSLWIAFSSEEGCVQPSVASLRGFCTDNDLKPQEVVLIVGQDPLAARKMRAAGTGDGSKVEEDVSLHEHKSHGGGTGMEHHPSPGPDAGIVNPTRAASIGMHCVCMRRSAIPDQVVSCAGKAAILYLPDINLSHFVGEVLGFPSPLDRNRLGFGPYSVPAAQVFASTDLSLAMVNHRAACAGHVLILPRRRAARFADLGGDEVADLWKLAQRVGDMVQLQNRADGVTFLLQDGEAAGQSVAHVHIHVCPRYEDSWEQSATLYEKIDSSDQRRPADGLDRELQPPSGVRSFSSGAHAGAGAGAGAGGSASLEKVRGYTELATEAAVYKKMLARMM